MAFKETVPLYGNEGGIELFNSERDRRSVDRPEFFCIRRADQKTTINTII
jgi:hypothetical protein